MKRIISFIIAAVFIFSLFACSDDTEEQIDTYIHTHYDEIYEAICAADDVSDVSDYILEWADSSGIKALKDSSSNVIMSSDATPGYEDAESTAFQCTIDLENPEHTALSVSIASYIISESSQHGFLRVIFTSSPDGIAKISRSHLQNIDNFISLDWYEKSELLVGSAGNEYYSITHELEWEAPSYTKAYEISVYVPDDIKSADTYLHKNPITYIGDILARAKSSNILLEVAGFNGGDSADTYPHRVSCVILVNQNDISKITRSINAAKEEFDHMYGADDSEYFFNFTEVETPDKVISYEDTANLISFLYTCIDGTYLKDDAGEVIAIANVGKIRTTSGNLEIEICASSKSSAVLSEMNSEFDTICGLCDISYSVKSGVPVWENRTETDSESYSEAETLENGYITASNELIDAIDVQIKEITGKESRKVRIFDETACSEAAKRNPEMNIVGFGLTKDDMLEQTEILINYLASLNMQDLS